MTAESELFNQYGSIRTTSHYPPIPDRGYDWSAVRDDYEPGHAMGTGESELEAILDLLEQEADLLCRQENWGSHDDRF